jgi:hypothetical protein
MLRHYGEPRNGSDQIPPSAPNFNTLRFIARLRLSQWRSANELLTRVPLVQEMRSSVDFPSVPADQHHLPKPTIGGGLSGGCSRTHGQLSHRGARAPPRRSHPAEAAGRHAHSPSRSAKRYRSLVRISAELLPASQYSGPGHSLAQYYMGALRFLSTIAQAMSP